MGYYLNIDDDKTLPLASNKGWGDFGRWASGLSDAPQVKQLYEDGWVEELQDLRVELSHSLSRNSPDAEVRTTAENLLKMVADISDSATVVSVTDGLGKGGGDGTKLARDPYYLSTSAPADLKPAVTLGQGYPTHLKVKVGGEDREVPVAYFWKDSIQAGEYVHPATKQKLSVDANRIDGWVDKFHKMRAAGIEIPTPTDHSAKAEHNLGFVVDAKRNGDRLSLLHQVIGEDAAMTALRNRCSLCIEPDYVDERGKSWGDAFTHSAFTPVPVVSGMGSFVPFAASRDQQTETPVFYLSADSGGPEMDYKILREALGVAADVPDDKLIDQVKALKATAATNLSRAETAEGKVKDLDAKVVTLSRTPATAPVKPTPGEIFFASKAVKSAREDAIKAGAITPAVATAAEARFLRKPVDIAKITLSRAVEDDDHKITQGFADLIDFYEVVKDNVPTPPLGSQTGLQSGVLLSREVPGAGGNDDDAKLAAAGKAQGDAYVAAQLAHMGK